ncbi:MAG: STAS domain-containing protein [Chloroflexota bacterium]
MEITITKIEGRVPVSLVQLNGDLDGSNFKDLIATAQLLYDEGVRHLLLDMAGLGFMSSAGLAALHIVTKVFGGEKAPDPEDGWATFRTMDRERAGGRQNNVKLLNPTERVLEVLDMVGFAPLYEIYTNLDEATQSF